MHNYFYELADTIQSALQGKEQFTCFFNGENSDFVRFNQSKFRQAGSVTQYFLQIDLINGDTHCGEQIALCGNKATDNKRAHATLDRLRQLHPELEPDPHLLIASEVKSTEYKATNVLPRSDEILPDFLQRNQGMDSVGIYAAGGIQHGFANSYGQRNWHSTQTFHLDWSTYYRDDKAVKASYAGLEWKPTQIAEKLSQVKQQHEQLKIKPRSLKAGNYRVYLSPSAVFEIVNLLNWCGFGIKNLKTKQSPLLPLFEKKHTLHQQLTLSENTMAGIAPNFQSQGFIKDENIPLIGKGSYQGSLISPRSAKEFSITGNGANDGENAESLVLDTGNLAHANVLAELGTGIYISNLWYLNYSNQISGQITGMTRFATFWVENGTIVAPLNVMRFDESIYRMLGENLVELTQEQEFIIDPSSYEQRSCSSATLPGLLIDDFHFVM